jgi:hypothetical protein
LSIKKNKKSWNSNKPRTNITTKKAQGSCHLRPISSFISRYRYNTCVLFVSVCVWFRGGCSGDCRGYPVLKGDWLGIQQEWYDLKGILPKGNLTTNMQIDHPPCTQTKRVLSDGQNETRTTPKRRWRKASYMRGNTN